MGVNGISSIVLIGAGRMGRAHVLAARELGLQLTAVCDKNAENCNRIANEFGLAETARFGDAATMFDKIGAADLVVVATTADNHCELVQLAARSNAKCILCEKPMGISLVECDAMIEACRRSGTRLAINHQMRFMDQYTLIREELESGRFGALSSMNVVSGCFGLSMNGSHYFEAFSWLTGDKIDAVTAWFSSEKLKNPRGDQFFDQAGQVRATVTSGARLNMEIGADQGHGMTVTYAMQYGHIFVDELEGVYFATVRKPEHLTQPPTRYGMPWDRWERRFPQADNVGPTRAVMDSLIRDDNYPSGVEGRQVVAALVAAYKSVDHGNREVRLSELDDYYEQRWPWA